jgi:hypothetical protein
MKQPITHVKTRIWRKVVQTIDLTLACGHPALASRRKGGPLPQIGEEAYCAQCDSAQPPIT